MSRSTSRDNARNLGAAAAFLAPFLALLLVFQYLPLVILARDSTMSYTLLNPSARKFVGLDNFLRVFKDPIALKSFMVTFILVAGFLLLVIPIGFLIAVFLNARFSGRGLVRTMIFLPVVTSTVVVSTMWTFILNENGLINSFLSSIGIGRLPFLTDPKLALTMVIVMTFWQQVGLAAVLFLGGLQSIPNEVVEAARVDGARGHQVLLRITIPLVSRTTLLVVVVMTVFGLQAFAPAYVMTAGGPLGATNFIIYHIYKTAFLLQQPGYASALAVLVLIVALAISLVQMRLLKTRWNY